MVRSKGLLLRWYRRVLAENDGGLVGLSDSHDRMAAAGGEESDLTGPVAQCGVGLASRGTVTP